MTIIYLCMWHEYVWLYDYACVCAGVCVKEICCMQHMYVYV